MDAVTNPYEVTWRFGGRQLGFSGNNGAGVGDQSFDALIADRRQVAPTNQGTFRGKQAAGSAHADFI